MSDNAENLLQRFAVSGLSRERKDEAINEEILIGKHTGEFFIKTKDGVVISTDILNRLKSSTDNAVRLAELSGIVGDLYKVDFEELVLPNHVDYSVNIIEGEAIELPINTNRILLNLDLDEYDILNNTAKPVNTNAIVKVVVEIGIETGEVSILEIEQSIQNINYYPIDIEFESVSSLVITEICIDKDEFFISEATDRAVLLHNIFVAINTKEV
jgi:hypothetical protein